MTRLYAIGEQQGWKVRNERISIGHQRSFSREFKLHMVQLLEKDEQNPSQISRDQHVTRSLLYVWWQLYRERGEAAFGHHAECWIFRTFRALLCGLQNPLA
jgi:transposase-like protein